MDFILGLERHQLPPSKLLEELNYKADSTFMRGMASKKIGEDSGNQEFFSLNSICISLPLTDMRPPENIRTPFEMNEKKEMQEIPLSSGSRNQFNNNTAFQTNRGFPEMRFQPKTGEFRSLFRNQMDPSYTTADENNLEHLHRPEEFSSVHPSSIYSFSGVTQLPAQSSLGLKKQVSSAESKSGNSPNHSHKSLESITKQKRFKEDKEIKKGPSALLHRRVATVMESSQELSRVSQPISVNQSYFASDNSSKPNDDSLIKRFMRNSQTNSMEESIEKDKLVKNSKSSKLNQEILVGLDDEPSDQIESSFNFEDMKENIVEMSSTNKGSRKMQSFLQTAEPEEIAIICEKIMPQVSAVMCDTYGNFMFQSLVEVCSKEERASLLEKATLQLAETVCNPKGTHSFQKLISKMEKSEEEAKLAEVLKGKVKKIALDQSGSHFLQKVIQNFQERNLGFVLEEIIPSIYEVATHPQGLCVLKVIFDKFNASPVVFQRLAQSIVEFTEKLSQNAYGNYLIQHVILVVIFFQI